MLRSRSVLLILQGAGSTEVTTGVPSGTTASAESVLVPGMKHLKSKKYRNDADFSEPTIPIVNLVDDLQRFMLN
jgi:hypothetical protein